MAYYKAAEINRPTHNNVDESQYVRWEKQVAEEYVHFNTIYRKLKIYKIPLYVA